VLEPPRGQGHSQGRAEEEEEVHLLGWGIVTPPLEQQSEYHYQDKVCICVRVRVCVCIGALTADLSLLQGGREMASHSPSNIFLQVKSD
jgi:hypothetical protein